MVGSLYQGLKAEPPAGLGDKASLKLKLKLQYTWLKSFSANIVNLVKKSATLLQIWTFFLGDCFSLAQPVVVFALCIKREPPKTV